MNKSLSPRGVSYKRILIATDGSTLAGKAVEQGFALARQLGADVAVVTVSEPWVPTASEIAIEPSWGMAKAWSLNAYEKRAIMLADKILKKASDRAKRYDMSCRTVHVKDSYPADGIIKAAKKERSDLIIMSSHGRRGLTRLLLGSQALAVLTHSKIPVLICR